MKKIIALISVFYFAGCGVNYKLSKACNLEAIAAHSGGGKITVCVICDSIEPRLIKKLAQKYGTNEKNKFYADTIKH